MKKLFTSCLSFLTITAFAQSPVANRILSGVDLGIGFQKGTIAPSVSYYELLTVGRQQIFSIGWTFSAGAVSSNDAAYITAPARLSRGKTGFDALSAPLVIRNIDTVQFERASQTCFNFGIRSQVKLGPVEIGGSADLLGFVLGRTRLGQVISSQGGYYVSNAKGKDSLVYFREDNQWQYAKAKGLNVRLLGDNDRGALATEAYIRFMINRRIGVKLAYKWLTTEMQLKVAKTADNNLRYRRRAEMPYVALTFPFFR